MNDINPPGGLASISEVEALADQLSSCADALHARLKQAMRDHQGAYSNADQASMRGLFDDEQLLRQRADSLYADAAKAVVAGLGEPQQHILALTADAAEKIRTIGKVGEVIGLVGGLLSLAGAAMAGSVSGVLEALDQVRTHAAGVGAHQPKPATP